MGALYADLVANVLGLLPAKQRVSVMLAEGYRLHDIAAMTASSYETPHCHLKRIFARHVQLVLSLSVMPDARR